MQQIPFNNLEPIQKLFDAGKALRRVMSSSNYIMGEELDKFEEAFAAYCFSTHCVGVASGTDAITLTLMALDIKKGDVVVTVANSAPPTVAAIRATGASVRFIDVDEYGLADLDKLKDIRLDDVRAFVPVHLYGKVVNLNAARDILQRNRILVVEDACQAHGSTSDDYIIGSNSVAACYSFYPTKNLGCLGDGGAVVTNDSYIAQEVAALSNYGLVNGKIVRYGKNSRLDELQAAFLLDKLKHMDKINAHKRASSIRYNSNLEDLGLIGTREVDAGENCHICPIFVEPKEREMLISYLRVHKVQTKIHYPIPAHKQPAEESYHKPLPMTETLCQTEVSLPNWYGISFKQIDAVCKYIRRFFDER